MQASDTGWIIRTGEYILNHAGLPEHDIFSWTCSDHPWILYQWVFELAAGAIFKLGSLWLVGLVCATILSVLYLYVLPRQWLDLGVHPAVTFAALSLVITQHWYYARPQLISFVLLTVFLSILESYRAKKSNLVWALPPLMVLWANTHSFWFIGLLILLSYAFSVPSGRAGVAAWNNLWLVLIACCGAVLINPYGWALVVYNASFLWQPDFQRIHELQPLLAVPAVPWGAIVFLCLGWILILSRRQTIPSAGLWLPAAGTVAGICFARLAPVAVLLMWPFAGLALSQLSIFNQLSLRSAGEFNPFSGKSLALLALAITVALISWTLSFPDPANTWLTHSDDLRPAMRILKELKPDRSIFNDATTGSNLILSGQGPVFIDTRFDVYGPEFCADWQACTLCLGDWQGYLTKYGITHILIGTRDPLHESLYSAPDWLLAFDDGCGSLWLANTAANRAKLAVLNFDQPRFAWLTAKLKETNSINQQRKQTETGKQQ